MSRKILLLGGSGQIGWELSRILAPLGEVVAPSSSELNLAYGSRVREFVRNLRPHWIINAAAYTAVDMAESDQDSAWKINSEAPKLLAEEAELLGAAMIHLSTDYIFDGQKGAPYIEVDPPNPLSVYGESKLAGEVAVREGCSNHLIFRTSWVYGARGNNFLLSMLRLFRERDELAVVDDQIGTPTWAQVVAENIALSMERIEGGECSICWGTYHLTNSGQTSWYGFAKRILEYGQRGSTPKILPIPTSEYPTAAERPEFSQLDNRKFEQAFGITLPDWETSLRDCLREL